MSKEIQIREGNLIASFDLENEDGDIDFCKLLKVSRGVADEIGMFVDYVATNKIIKDQSKKISDLEAKLAEKDKEITQRLVIQESDYNQDKISFAVEQLEEVKELLFSKAIQPTGTSIDAVRLYSINEIFNNQIKQLKEMK